MDTGVEPLSGLMGREMVVAVVINTVYGGYGLSLAAQVELARRKGMVTRVHPNHEDILLVGIAGWKSLDDVVPRWDADLVDIVRTMGDAANGQSARLCVVEHKVTIDLEVENHDGRESSRVVASCD